MTRLRLSRSEAAQVIAAIRRLAEVCESVACGRGPVEDEAVRLHALADLLQRRSPRPECRPTSEMWERDPTAPMMFID